jgi:hypothetical protein
MRKRVSCRVIRSVRLGKAGEALHSPATASVGDFRVAGPVTYSRRLITLRPCPDEAAGPRTLDLYI